MSQKTTNWKQLASEYGIGDTRTFKRILDPIMDELDEMKGHEKQRTVTPKMVEAIRSFLGDPEQYK